MEESLRTEEGAVYKPGVQQPDKEAIWADYVYYDLDPIDQKIFEWRTGRNGQKVLTVTEIAKRLKMSPASVSQRAKRISQLLASGVEV